jgi:hypothetical protein
LRHFDVQKDQIRLKFFDGFNCLRDIFTFFQQFNIRTETQQEIFEYISCTFLIVYEYGSYSIHSCKDAKQLNNVIVFFMKVGVLFTNGLKLLFYGNADGDPCSGSLIAFS